MPNRATIAAQSSATLMLNAGNRNAPQVEQRPRRAGEPGLAPAEREQRERAHRDERERRDPGGPLGPEQAETVDDAAERGDRQHHGEHVELGLAGLADVDELLDPERERAERDRQHEDEHEAPREEVQDDARTRSGRWPAPRR